MGIAYKNVVPAMMRRDTAKVRMVLFLLLLLPFLPWSGAVDYIHDPVQYQAIATDTGAYHFGYNTGVLGAHSFHEEWRDENGEVHGRYGLTDPNGNLRIVTYTAGRDGYRAVQTIQPGNGVQPRQRPQPGSGDVLVTPGAKTGATVFPGRYRPTTPAPVDDEDDNNYRNALGDYHQGDVVRPGGVIGTPLASPKRSVGPPESRRFPFVSRTPLPFNDIGEPLPPVLYHRGVPYRPTVYRNGVPYTGSAHGLFVPGNVPREGLAVGLQRFNRAADSKEVSPPEKKEEA
ncbi:uncharacterized protein LOC135370040 isoform X2 [Ornithodoros turicata]